MSLRVWLPLNRNINNYGVSDIVTAVSGATINTNGKIGSCYAFDGSDDYISLTGSDLYRIFSGGSQQFSIAFWVYHNDSTRAIIFGDYNLSGAIQFNIELTTGHGVRFYWNNAPDKNFNSISNVAASGWTHICLTYDGSKVCIYKDGVLSSDVYNGVLATKNKTTGSFYLGRDSRTGTTTLNGRLNDFRIYDHALSTLEVKEISQALVLHYKLDGNLFGNPNLLANTHFDIRYNQTSGWDTTKNGTLLASNWGGYNSGVANPSTCYHAHLKLFENEYVYEFIKDTESWLGISQSGLQYKLVAGKTYTFSCEQYSVTNTNYMYGGLYYFKTGANSASFHLGYIYCNTNRQQGVWQKYTYTFTAPSDGDYSKNMSWYCYGHNGSAGTFYLRHLKLEEGNTATTWCLTDSELNLNRAIVIDESGYGYNGNITGTLTVSADTARYKNSCYMPQATTITHNNPVQSGTDQEWTCAMWVKLDTVGVGNIQLNNFNNGNRIVHSANGNALLYLNAGTNDYYNYSSISVSAGVWTHIAFVFKNSNATKLIYINGENRTNTGGPNKTSTPYGIPDIVTVGTNLAGYISDYRIYATALLAEDIKKLYNTSMSIDDKNRGHIYETIENYNNLMFKQNSALYIKQFVDGLSRYTQSNCQVTLTDDGIRIYRPANLTTTNDGNTMYGGLKICNSSSDTIHVYNKDIDNILGLQKNHTYIWIFHVKGQTANAPGFQVSNNMGWGGGGLVPSPSNVISKGIGSNFDGETDVWYKFTISDEIVKTCTTAYSSFVKDSSYLSYKHFGWNWSYTNTGTGTDIYITNIRLYDITTTPKGQITKTGLANFTSLFELDKNLHIIPDKEILLNEFIER